MIEVVEPATEQVMAEVPRAGRRRGRRGRRAGQDSISGLARRSPRPTERALLHRLADALAEHAEELALLEARNAGKPIGDARGEMEMVVDTFRYYAGAPRAAARRHDPGRRRAGVHGPRAARRRRADRAVELPAA